MAASIEGNAEIWKVLAEDLDDQSSQGPSPRAVRRERSPADECIERFDLITCLWNVLGHIRKVEDRARAMQAMANRLAPDGRCFIDVNHRYNLRSYGVIPSAARFIRDSISFQETSADVIAKWRIGGESISTYGHVFTDKEIRRLTRAAGLSIEARIVVDYETGKIRRLGFAGNLLYVLRRGSRIESSSAAHTS